VLVGSLGWDGLRSGELPPAAGGRGRDLGGEAVLSPVSLAAKPAMVLILLSRLSALVVSGIAGVRLGRHPR
jgi:hypothetical protein